MTAENLAAALRAGNARTPFRPFALVLTDGTRLECDVPGCVNFLHGIGGHIAAGGVPAVFTAREVERVVPDSADGRGPSAG